jgi:HYR domain
VLAAPASALRWLDEPPPPPPPGHTITPPHDVTKEAVSGDGAFVNYDNATVDPPDESAACTPGSGSQFPIGTTTVTCTADDANDATFNVTVQDTTPPAFGAAPDVSVDTMDATGIVNYTAPTASDPGDVSNPVSVNCTPAPGSFPIGTTPVGCTATDSRNNQSATGFNVTVHDVAKPTLNVPSDTTIPATSSAGAPYSYSVTASDNSGAVTVSCDHDSGNIFPPTTTTVICTATDPTGNSAQKTWQLTVTPGDFEAPVFSNVPPDKTVEANGPAGAIVSYTEPSAVDAVDGPEIVTCNPGSGFLLGLGTTTVSCSTTDAHGNGATVTFHVTVVDTTPPTLAIPVPTTFYATTPTGIPETAPAFIAFRNAASADDIVDPHPTLGDNLGSFAEVGTHDVGFFARDASGNVTARATQLTVLPMPPAGTPPLPLPPPAKLPADVPSLQIFPGDGFVRLVWGAVPGAARYLVYRSVSGTRRLTADGHGELVYSGTATTYTDRGLTNGVEYRYVVVSEDATGNQSAGVGSPAVPRLNLLHRPKDGAKVKTPPKLTWARNAEANYYNVQLFRRQAKILSTWPVGASLKLKRTWKYQGRRYTLTNGVYRWYVWPGFGARSAVDYGELLGSNSFQMTR